MVGLMTAVKCTVGTSVHLCMLVCALRRIKTHLMICPPKVLDVIRETGTVSVLVVCAQRNKHNTELSPGELPSPSHFKGLQSSDRNTTREEALLLKQ